MDKTLQKSFTHPPNAKTSGFCRRCKKVHWLGPGNTLHHCRKLMHHLAHRQTIDLLLTTQPESAAALGTAPLFGPARGKMFGVMECLKPDGSTVVLYAFSGQYNGLWLIKGWVPPLFELNDFLAMTIETEKQIKRLGREIDGCPPQSSEWLALRKKRRQVSRNLMHDIHTLYALTNFRGETATIQEAFIGNNGIPTGTGDCCAPKLLNFAAQNRLRPLGMSEFFWGKENKSGDHKHTVFASSCVEKCRPILGFMLCGLEADEKKGMATKGI